MSDSIISAAHLLEVKGLRVEFPSKSGEPVHAVNGISFDINAGEAVGIVGESGSGKSVSAYSIMGLLSKPGKITGGEIVFDGKDLRSLTVRELERIRGSRIGMVFQNPMASLNPAFTIGNQLIEAVRCHKDIPVAEAKSKAAEMLSSVGITDIDRRLKQYPHELSGGMLQRTMIAMALICGPDLLIADEPTTGLDVTIQAQVLALLKRLRAAIGLSVLFVTHNLGIVADLCERVVVLYAGYVMERGRVEDLFYSPAHPYTKGLLRAIPRIDQDKNERLTPIEGVPVNMEKLTDGCVFHPRCRSCMEICRSERPPERDLGGGHSASCWLLEAQKG